MTLVWKLKLDPRAIPDLTTWQRRALFYHWQAEVKKLNQKKSSASTPTRSPRGRLPRRPPRRSRS